MLLESCSIKYSMLRFEGSHIELFVGDVTEVLIRKSVHDEMYKVLCQKLAHSYHAAVLEAPFWCVFLLHFLVLSREKPSPTKSLFGQIRFERHALHNILYL